MRELFDSLLTAGQQIEVTVGWDGTVSTISCSFLASDKDYVAIRLDDGVTRVFRRDMVLYVDIPKLSADFSVMDSTEGSETFGNNISAVPSADKEYEEEDELTETGSGDVYNITPTLSAPKVIGKIDLSQFNIKKKIQTAEPQEDLENNFDEDSAKWLPANGYIERLGPQFGFIRPLDGDGGNIFLPRNEFVSMAGILDAPQEGDHVIFTYGMNSRGTVAKCVHKQCTVNTQERLISKLSRFDSKAASLLRQQLEDAYASEAFCDHPEERLTRSMMANNFRMRNVEFCREVIEAIENGENVPSQDLLACEKALARFADYEGYLASSDKLLRYSKIYDRPRAYQLYHRITKTARDNGDEETAMKYVQEACDFYANEPGSYKTFSDLRDRIRNVNEKPVIPTDEEIAEMEARLDSETEETE